MTDPSAEERLTEIRKMVTGANAHGGPLLFLINQLDAEKERFEVLFEQFAFYAYASENYKALLCLEESHTARLVELVRDFMEWMHNDESTLGLVDLERRAAQELEGE